MPLPESSLFSTKTSWDICQLRLAQDYTEDNGESVQVTKSQSVPVLHLDFIAVDPQITFSLWDRGEPWGKKQKQ
jgi:hypothetical protein